MKKIFFVICLLFLSAFGLYWVRQTYFLSPFDRWVSRAERADSTVWGNEPRPNAVKFYAKALEVWKPVDGIRKKLDILVLRGDLLRLQGDSQEAKSDYTEAIELNQNDLRPLEARATIFLNAHEYDKAIDDLTTALELGRRLGWPQEWMHHSLNGDEIFYSRGLAFYEKKDFQKALLDFAEAITREPLTGEYYLMRGKTWNQLKKYDAAIRDLTLGIRMAKEHGVGPTMEYYQERGKAYTQLGEHDKAAQDHAMAGHLKH